MFLSSIDIDHMTWHDTRLCIYFNTSTDEADDNTTILELFILNYPRLYVSV